MRLSMPKILSSKPWLLVVLLFGGFVACWIFFITLAIKHAPRVVPVATQNANH
jgi:F0F1-type ATP synthase assembly protein I